MAKLRRTHENCDTQTPTLTSLHIATQFLLSAATGVAKGQQLEHPKVQADVQHALTLIKTLKH